ncbi:Cysteine-rich secretory protein family protein [uncultured archaeon]|nr:Cysteine-rich secretory protein family protein [uncultured archaeon]
MSKLQQFTLDDINQYRQANKVQPLTMINEEPSSAYAKVLLSERCLHHVQDNGITPQGRFHNAGIDSFSVGENLAGGQKAVFDNLENFVKNRNYDMMFRDADSNWGHRQNILDPKYTAISIGIDYDATNMVIVEDFLTTLQSDEYVPPSAYSDIADLRDCW